MGIFPKYVKVFNRAPIRLYVTFDGQREPIEPGVGELPDVTVLFAKNQNPIMGSADPNNPNVDGGKYLIVVEGEDGYGKPLSADQWAEICGKPCRMDMDAVFAEKYGNDKKAKMILHGSPGKPAAKSRYEAGTNPGGNAAFSGRAE